MVAECDYEIKKWIKCRNNVRNVFRTSNYTWVTVWDIGIAYFSTSDRNPSQDKKKTLFGDKKDSHLSENILLSCLRKKAAEMHSGLKIPSRGPKNIYTYIQYHLGTHISSLKIS